MSFTESERDTEEKSQKTEKLGRICKDKRKRSPDLQTKLVLQCEDRKLGFQLRKTRNWVQEISTKLSCCCMCAHANASMGA